MLLRADRATLVEWDVFVCAANDVWAFLRVANDVAEVALASGARVWAPFLLVIEYLALKDTCVWICG